MTHQRGFYSNQQQAELEKGWLTSHVRYAIPTLINGKHLEKEKVVEMLCGIIRAGGPEVASMVAREGAIKPLVQMLVNGTTRGKCLSAIIMSYLTMLDNARAQVVERGAIPPLIKLCSCGTDEIQGVAASALSNIAHNSEQNTNQLVNANAIKHLVPLLSSRLLTTQQAASQALVNITAFHNDAVRSAWDRSGGIKAIVNMLEPNRNPLPEIVLGILAAKDSSNTEKIVKAGAIKPLVSLTTSTSTSLDKRVSAACLLTQIAENPKCHQQLVDNGAIRALIDVLVHLPINSHPEAPFVKQKILLLLKNPSPIIQQVTDQYRPLLAPTFASYNNTTQSLSLMPSAQPTHISPVFQPPIPLSFWRRVWAWVWWVLVGFWISYLRGYRSSRVISSSTVSSPPPSSETTRSLPSPPPVPEVSSSSDLTTSLPEIDFTQSPSGPIRDWQVEDVAAWATSLNLSKDYRAAIEANHITGKVLQSMTKEDWNEIGVTVFGDVRTLLNSVASLQ